MSRHPFSLASVVLLLLLLPPASSQNINDEETCLRQPVFICALRPTTGNVVRGTVVLSPFFMPSRIRRRCVVRVRAVISNLTPGEHGFHIHTYGDLTLDTGLSAGGHFTNRRAAPLPHGFPSDRPRHWGDFGNLTANGDGVAIYDRVDQIVRLRSPLGRGIIVHELADMGPDEQPSGAAGSRQASCVIGFANPASLTEELGF